MNHVTGLLDLGYDVDIYAFGVKDSESPEHRQLYDYGLEQRITYLPIALTARSDAIARFLEKGYCAVHCHFGEVAERIAFLKTLIPDTLFYVTFHGKDIRAGLERSGHLYAATFNHFDGIIAICNYNRNSLLRLGCPQHKLIDLPNNVNTQTFRPSKNNRSENLRIVTVARLHEAKNIPFALCVMNALKRENGNFIYTLLGDGKVRADIETAIQAYGLDGHVRLLGQCSQEEVVEQLAGADVFFLPSRAEASPICLLEAQAAGLPVVTTRVGGTADSMIDGVTGFLIESNDVEAACKKLGRLMQDRVLLAAMGNSARQFIEEKFDFRRSMRRCRMLYRTAPVPRVSVIIPTYNRKAFISRAIDSVLCQSFQNFELIIVDDGSTDDTASLVQTYVERYPATIRYEYRRKQNASAARNYGIAIAQGEFVAFLDSDDYWHPDKLHKQAAFLDANPTIGFVHTDRRLEFMKDYTPVDILPVPTTLARNSVDCLRGDCIVYMTVLARKHLIEAAGCFDETFTTTQDTELWIRMAKMTELALLDEVLTYVRRHSRHLSTDNPEQKYSDRIRLYNRLLADDHSAICKVIWNKRLVQTGYGLAREKFKKGRYGEALVWAAQSLGADMLVGGARVTDADGLSDKLKKLLAPYQFMIESLFKKGDPFV